MNIDFHYGVVYATARLGGLLSADALTVAHACQYVDDSTTLGLLDFVDGEMFERFPTALHVRLSQRLQPGQPAYVGAIPFPACGYRRVTGRARDLPAERRCRESRRATRYRAPHCGQWPTSLNC